MDTYKLKLSPSLRNNYTNQIMVRFSLTTTNKEMLDEFMRIFGDQVYIHRNNKYIIIYEMFKFKLDSIFDKFFENVKNNITIE